MTKTNNRNPETLLDTQRAWEERVKRNHTNRPDQMTGNDGDKQVESSSKGKLMESFGSNDPDFIRGLLQQVMNVTSVEANKIDANTFEFICAVMKGYKPADELEAMQTVQMAAIHNEVMRCVGRLARAETLLEVDSYERAVNKLARTYTMQMEALQRYRRARDHQTTGQQASVPESERLMVKGTQKAQKGPAGERVTLTDAPQPTMPPINDKPEREPVPLRRRRKDDEEFAA
jgi:hypothetical protein